MLVGRMGSCLLFSPLFLAVIGAIFVPFFLTVVVMVIKRGRVCVLTCTLLNGPIFRPIFGPAKTGPFRKRSCGFRTQQKKTDLNDG